MQKKLTLPFLILLVCIACDPYSEGNSNSHPLRKTELLALVSGGIIPENLAYEIRTKGLNFVPDESYKALLKSAGADAKVLAALNTAKTGSSEKPDSAADSELLQHLSHAGSLIKSGHLDEAAEELASSLAGDSGKTEVGFVIGKILIEQQRMEEAGQVYSEILRQDPSFPQVHTRLSATYYQTGDPENTLREAKAALEQNPDYPAAHMNAGLALREMRNFDAAKGEMQQAIRCKPDYALAYSNLGILLGDLHDYDGAIAQYKKALALNPDDVNARYNLGVAYDSKGDNISAIREYREVKRRDPKRLDARQNLGAALMHADPGAAITEFRELAALAPDWPLCHQCLGGAYLRVGRLAEAEKEYRFAIQQNPASAAPLSGLGATFETEKKYDEALAEYHKAEKLDSTDAYAFTSAGRVFIMKKDFSSAIPELQQAERLDPADWSNHDLHGQALEGSGDRKAATIEYKEAVSLSPKALHARLDLAAALEKSSDWVAALGNYHQGAIDEPPPTANGIAELRYDAQNKYEAAQQRYRQHLSDLRTNGKSSEADALEASLKEKTSAPNLDEKFHAAMETSKQAEREKRFNDAETFAKEAVAIAEKIQPPDGRLPEALGELGSIYAWRLDYKNANDTFKRQLALSQRLYGPESPMLAAALQNLAMTALAQNDFVTAETDFSRVFDLNKKTYGENSNEAATALSGLARVYFVKKDFPKAEEALLHSQRIFETIYGENDYRLALPINGLCYLYDQSDNPEKSASCHGRLVSLEEKQFGAESPYLLRDLTAEAEALRKLGRSDEAAKIERRTQSLQSAQTNPN